MNPADQLVLGLDFGTESVRALLVDLSGRERGIATRKYRHGQILEALSGSGVKLPPHYALQHPGDWIEAAAEATREAVAATGLPADSVLGIGVDFTSCTMLPALRDGTPLCRVPRWAGEPLAWPKLWKHHGAQAQTDRINEVARQRKETFLPRYGGSIGVEWFFPKVLETLEHAPAVYEAAEVWLEAGDWFVWQLVGGPAEELPRSTCQAGYKGMWSAGDGFPSREFLGALAPALAEVVAEKMPGRLLAPGTRAGGLCGGMAETLGLRAGTPVSAAIIDAHAGVPGAGAAEPGTLVMVLGTSSCHMLNATTEHAIPGVAGIVRDGILPGYFGYETGQAAVGDAFDWLRRLTGQNDFKELDRAAAALPPGADGVLCLDWLNGCRTPLMDHSLTGSFTGLRLHHTAAHLYRALIEATACGVRWIVDLLREGGVPVERFVATGGLPHHNPLITEIYAGVLGEPIAVHPCQHGPALGAAILGALAAGLFDSPSDAIRTLASAEQPVMTTPNPHDREAFEALYVRYRALAAQQARLS
jgi:L-ribulokinase